MVLRGLGFGIATQHPCDLSHTGIARESPHGRLGESLALVLLYEEMTARLRGELGKMGHDEHLMIPCHVLQLGGDQRSHRSAESGIDFVEDQRRNWIDARQKRRQGAEDEGKLTAAGNSSE